MSVSGVSAWSRTVAPAVGAADTVRSSASAPTTYGQRVAFGILGTVIGLWVGGETDGAAGAGWGAMLGSAAAVMVATAGREGPNARGTLAGALAGGLPWIVAAHAWTGQDAYGALPFALLSFPAIPALSAMGSNWWR